MPALDSLFEALKFDPLAAPCDALLEQAAKKDLGYRELLTEALSCEWQGRQHKGAEVRLAQARLPWLKTLEPFDFSFQPSIDRKGVRELSALGFVGRAENVVLLGPPSRASSCTPFYVIENPALSDLRSLFADARNPQPYPPVP